MTEIMEHADELFIVIVNVISYFFSIIGVLVLTTAVCRAFVNYLKHMSNRELQLGLARGMQLSLQFLLGGEILKTIIAEDWSSILAVGAIIVLRFAMNFTIHWETHELCNERLMEQEGKL